MSFADIGELLATLSPPSALGLQELADTGADWSTEFFPAIRKETQLATLSVRRPRWYVLRFVFLGEILLTRVLRMVGQEYMQFKYELPDGSIRSWLPGYLFVRFDVERDFWQQIIDFPHVTELLGNPSPISDEIMRDMELRFPFHRAIDKKPVKTFCRGSLARITAGTMRMFTLAITDVNFITQMVSGDVTIFGRPSRQTFRMSDVSLV